MILKQALLDAFNDWQQAYLLIHEEEFPKDQIHFIQPALEDQAKKLKALSIMQQMGVRGLVFDREFHIQAVQSIAYPLVN